MKNDFTGRTGKSALLHTFRSEECLKNSRYSNRVHSVGIFGGSYMSFPISMGGSGKVYGILSVPKQCNGREFASSAGSNPFLIMQIFPVVMPIDVFQFLYIYMVEAYPFNNRKTFTRGSRTCWENSHERRIFILSCSARNTCQREWPLADVLECQIQSLQFLRWNESTDDLVRVIAERIDRVKTIIFGESALSTIAIKDVLSSS